MYLIFDTETTGLPQRKDLPHTEVNNWPRLVQLAWQLHDHSGGLLEHACHTIQPEGFDIPFKAEQIHGISTAKAEKEGKPILEVLQTFQKALSKTLFLVGHNIDFDVNIVGAEYVRADQLTMTLMALEHLDTSLLSREYCQLKGGIGGRLKIPRLEELYNILFSESFGNEHHAAYDVRATGRCFFELIKKGIIDAPVSATLLENIAYEAPVFKSAKENSNTTVFDKPEIHSSAHTIDSYSSDLSFCHLHVHSQFSILQATPSPTDLVKTAKKYNMPAIGMTDLGNMYGVFQFVDVARSYDIKPIVGCEFYVSEDRKKVKFTKDNPDRRYQQVLLAKNKTGYFNLSKLSSLGFTEGLYGNYPRIDKELIVQHREGLIATTGGLYSEISYLILHVGEQQAEQVFRFWHELFQDDFYAELNRHDTPEEVRVNKTLLRFCEKYGVSYFAANEAFYLNKKDADAHDTLLCIKEREFKATPIGQGRGFRYGMPNHQYYLKTQEEMKKLFHDLPQAIKTTEEIIGKIETYVLAQDVLLPRYDIPTDFIDEDSYLKHLAYEGASKRYTRLTEELRKRIDFELSVISKTGYPGYFLIVADITNAANNMQVSVGPGRGSAAGSVVAYCIGITHVDPIKYDLLFERFLNPDRISLPDIDIDFDDEGRDRVLQYVIKKYGQEQVAQIVTYGTMAARSAIRDSARVMEIGLNDVNKMTKLIPDHTIISLEEVFDKVKELEEMKESDTPQGESLRQAIVLEGSLRNTATHACGIIIAPKRLIDLTPVSVSRGSSMLITQYDNSAIEKAGLLKMDFLGVTTLNFIKTAIQNIKKQHHVEIDINNIPLDDKKTFKLFQEGNTTGIFQFESEGMQAYLKKLKPDKFEDLIAMNALYRPGPMEYITSYINRKHGKEAIHYDLPVMESFLSDTYGITVYQEQVMLLSQELAGFSKGDADVLRKAMGKKQKDVLDQMKDKFISGCQANSYDLRISEKIWKDWEAFAYYAFNKSHSTCYALIAYQTAYLQSHYPASYMAAVLTHVQRNLDKVTFFIEACKKNNIVVLGPHINDSDVFFQVNQEGEIRFGLAAIKGVGRYAATTIVEERDRNGAFKDIFDFTVRVSKQTINKRVLEVLALSGSFDCFPNIHRRQFVAASEGKVPLTEKLMHYNMKFHKEQLSMQGNLFGGAVSANVLTPKIADVLSPFDNMEQLQHERDVLGVYISGHPLDHHKFELRSFCNTSLLELNKLENYRERDIKVGGIVISVQHNMTKYNKPYGRLTLEDYTGKFEFMLWAEQYVKFKGFLTPGYFLFVEGRVKKKLWGDESMIFDIRDINLLNGIAEKRAKGIHISINLDKINEKLIKDIEHTCKKHIGQCPLYLRIIEQEQNIYLNMLSRNLRVKPVNEMVQALTELEDMTIELSS